MKITLKKSDNATNQILPIMKMKYCSGHGEGRKNNGRGGGKMVCFKVAKDGV